MNRKLIFFDIDGTILPFGGKITPKVKAAIQGAKAKGHGVFLCTGRNMPSIIDTGILDLGFDGVIASAGSHIEVGGEVLLDSKLPEEVIQECLDVFHRNGIFCCIETEDGTYSDVQMEEMISAPISGPANSELMRLRAALARRVWMKPHAAYPRQGGYKICFTSQSMESVDKSKAVLGDRFDIVVHPFGDRIPCYNGEIIRKDADKGLAVEQVCRHLGVDVADSVAFGDSMNDYAMLRRAGTGVAMGNACRELKEACGIVCEDVDHDGVYYQMVRMGLCEPI